MVSPRLHLEKRTALKDLLIYIKINFISRPQFIRILQIFRGLRLNSSGDLLVSTVCQQMKLSLFRPCNDCVYSQCKKQCSEEITYLFPFSVISHLGYQNLMLINIIL